MSADFAAFFLLAAGALSGGLSSMPYLPVEVRGDGSGCGLDRVVNRTA